MRLLYIFWLLLMVGLWDILIIEKATAQIGGYSGAYLRNGIGVRAQGMGNAFIAIADQVTAGYWNPAGLARIKRIQFGVMRSILSLDRQLNYAAIAVPIKTFGSFSLTWINYHVASIEARDQLGGLIGTFSEDNNALLFSYGVNLSKYLSLGITSKIFLHKLFYNSASGGGLDFGLQLKPLNFLSLAATIQNIYTSIKWDTDLKRREYFPHIGRFGLGIQLKKNIRFCFDWELFNPPNNNWMAGKNRYEKWRLGGEILLRDIFAFRSGFDNGRIAFGASVFIHEKNPIEVCYGFTNDPINYRGVHKFEFLIKFGKVPTSPKPKISSKKRSERSLYLAKILERRGSYLIIDLGKEHGLYEDLELKVYRKTTGTTKIVVRSIAKVMRVQNRNAIIKIESIQFLADIFKGTKIAVEFYIIDTK